MRRAACRLFIKRALHPNRKVQNHHFSPYLAIPQASCSERLARSRLSLPLEKQQHLQFEMLDCHRQPAKLSDCQMASFAIYKRPLFRAEIFQFAPFGPLNHLTHYDC